MQARDEAGVTAVVVTHNSARHLAPLGRALSAGSLAPARMLAVDNLSDDGTVEQARAAGFEVLETGANRGFGAGCNVGLACDAHRVRAVLQPRRATDGDGARAIDGRADGRLCGSDRRGGGE